MCTSPHSDRSSRRGWPARHNVGSWTLMCSWKTACLGWKRKGHQCSTANNLMQKIQRVCEEEKRQVFLDEEDDGEGQLQPRWVWEWQNRLFHSVDAVYLFHFYHFCLKTEAKQRERQHEFRFHKMLEIKNQRGRGKQKSYGGSVVNLLQRGGYKRGKKLQLLFYSLTKHE